MTGLEKFRPTTFDGIVGQPVPLNVLRGYIASAKNGGMFPSFLFSGPPGTGKTCMAMATAREMLGPSWENNWLELNGSDSRKIDDIRERVKPWVEQMPIDAPFRILFFDEADALTHDAQNALKRIMERSDNTARFIFSCNRLAGLIDAIQSRCVVLRFKPIPKDDMRKLLVAVATKENKATDEARFDMALENSRGDARRAIHILLGQEEGDTILKVGNAINDLFKVGMPREKRIEEFVSFLRAEGMTDWEDVLEALANHVLANPALVGSPAKASEFLYEVGNCAFKSTMVQNQLLQLRAFLYGSMP
jgi:replication factor C small subunit